MSRDYFRTKESLEEEIQTRSMLREFLEARGFTQIGERRISNGQTIDCIDPGGNRVSMRIKLCWRYDRDGKSSDYSAAQILGKVKDDEWVGSIQKFADRRKKEGSTHFLFVQREGWGFRHAAKIPVDSLALIWEAQRVESDRLNAITGNSKRKANQVKNGRSPTLWLEDQKAVSIAKLLWNFPGVEDLKNRLLAEDFFGGQFKENDPLGIDLELFGRDEAERILKEIWSVKRNTKVRKAVIERSKGRCENEICHKEGRYNGFLDVHHILGIEKSDQYWTCVALCPNCHRDAHAAPGREPMNQKLLKYAEQFKSVDWAKGLPPSPSPADRSPR